MKPLWSAWPAVKKRLVSNKGLLLLLDFDGTLVPIVKKPDAVSVSRETRRLLGVLSRQKDRVLAVISGRSLKDVRSRIRLPGVVYIGNHGLEMAGKGVRRPGRSALSLVRSTGLHTLAEMFRRIFYFWPGVLIEDKTYTLSLHFRNLPADRRRVFDELIGFYRRKLRHRPIVWRKGKKVWEIRPVYGWGKGEAAGFLSKKFSSFLPIAVGDDTTDEDMFRTLKRKGVTVRVGRSRTSCAQFFVRSQKDVRRLLEGLCP